MISAIGSDAPARRRIDADGLLVLPGIVDIHGDAFERQMMPRPGVDFAMDIALLDSDRQAVGQRDHHRLPRRDLVMGAGPARPGECPHHAGGARTAAAAACADTRFHLRHETFNLEAEPEILQWLSGRRIDLVAFNDHMLIADETSPRSKKLATMVERSALSREAFLRLVDRVRARGTRCRPRSSGSRRPRWRTASRCSPTMTPAPSSAAGSARSDAGCGISDHVATAQEAAAEGDDIVLGAPNVVRGGSHMAGSTPRRWWGAASARSWPRTITTRRSSWRRSVWPTRRSCRCTPPGRWSSQTAAAAARLADRGAIARGRRADLILVDTQGERPRAHATSSSWQESANFSRLVVAIATLGVVESWHDESNQVSLFLPEMNDDSTLLWQQAQFQVQAQVILKSIEEKRYHDHGRLVPAMPTDNGALLRKAILSEDCIKDLVRPLRDAGWSVEVGEPEESGLYVTVVAISGEERFGVALLYSCGTGNQTYRELARTSKVILYRGAPYKQEQYAYGLDIHVGPVTGWQPPLAPHRREA